MNKFMVLYQSPVSGSARMDDATPEQMEASMAEWIAWRDKVGKDKVEFGMPLTAGKHLEGANVTGGSTTVSGYSIIQADSLDAASEMLKDHPHLKTPGCSIELLEFLSMTGM